MKCPFCDNIEDRVMDSREVGESAIIRRRRECLKCGKRFTTYERIEKIPYVVVKKDGRREPFDRNKMVGGLLKACAKRPIEIAIIERIVDDVESDLHNNLSKEISASMLGEIVMKNLWQLDKVAYLRFTSVHRHYENIDDFIKEAGQIKARGTENTLG
ncbi:transcriptional regulator NrdR [Candidatus Desantisbacteria bacterium CG2_30_40_21]|uniref:Transcriptional repressor NrdR n=5 Tax=unclassified Candidatus Desantisiibacteriota TaxID=3106372 RepID=A0A2M7JF19_9BACT|nr:MAG: transcriptional regulator NrdR [Candidatus Desantisbacteria bacterium CG2_30_40_21]PIP40509.1 MAG: transcriptional regulator NrdR [Candidatus Desantisbacteria bacterium CG23_combo_of_CG06-09_8_20_14_all_40_23]PIX17976.1 MAG: transcriptional regulator NrdR [Candidatus Desantisbacteria bacterium CG_4_8_14_3_um_filter_40_12]PIY19738.1 MAG: transcriptional regulator NrdR [Candidatus Desantisbacteria bacterium CG_4_10_14_3_um_filter_40_18]PJB29637.1 MAG: transcriptional regulator NrdR [Candi